MSSVVLEWLQFYRLVRWEQKVSNFRLLLYPALAYSVAGVGGWARGTLNLVALLGTIMFQGALNDYWDYRTSGERNRCGEMLERLRPSRSRLVFWLVAPLALCVPMFALLWSEARFHPAAVLLIVGALLAFAYSTPPLRLKSRRPFAMLVAPLLTTCMFLESSWIDGWPEPEVWPLAGLLFLFQLYAEAIHSVVNDSAHDEKCTPRTAWWIACRVPVISLLVALALAFWRPWFWLSVAGGSIRLAALRSSAVSAVPLRAQGQLGLTSPLLSLYEFLGYAVLGTLRALV